MFVDLRFCYTFVVLTEFQELGVRRRVSANLNELQMLLFILNGESPPIPFKHGEELGSAKPLFEDICRQCWEHDPEARSDMESILQTLRSSKENRKRERDEWLRIENEAIERKAKEEALLQAEEAIKLRGRTGERES